MYTVDAASSETVWLKKCSTLIGSGTLAWMFICGPRGSVIIRFQTFSQSAASCRFRSPISPQFTEFQLLADGDNIIYMDNSL